MTSETLTIDEVMRFLEMIPPGPVRSLLWNESAPISSIGSRLEMPDDIEDIEALAELKSTDSFLALLGRLRLRQLLGQLDYDDVYELELVNCFATIVARAPHLCIAEHTMLATFADFIDWHCQPNLKNRFRSRKQRETRIEFWNEIRQEIELVKKQSRKEDVPPQRYIERCADIHLRLLATTT